MRLLGFNFHILTMIDFHFEKPEDSSGYLLWQLTMHWQRSMKQGLDTLGITHTQFVLMAALAWLQRDNTAVTQIQIAQHSNTDAMMVSTVLRNLQQKGLLLRHEHATDTRAKTVALTDEGRVLLQKALKIVANVDDAFFDVLGEGRSAFNKMALRLLE
jgi:DNA-binding MarR family transcriptional regulator